jgi:hypothetical protein
LVLIWLVIITACAVAVFVFLGKARKERAHVLAQRENQLTTTAAPERAPDVTSRSIILYDCLKALPDGVAVVQKVRSSTLGKSYEVNLAELSCTCANWQGDRCRYAPTDIRRLCKHLAAICVIATSCNLILLGC